MTHPPGGPGTRAEPEFDPWNSTPVAAEQAPVPAGPPVRRRRTGLIAGVVGAVVVLAGGATAFVLLNGDDGGATGATTDTGGPAGGPVVVTAATPAGVAQAAINAYTNRSATQYVALLCATPSRQLVDDLQRQLASATQLNGSVTGVPVVTGTSASVEVTVVYNGQTENPRIPMKQQGRKWCIDES